MSRPESNSWHFLTNHAQVLLCIEHNPDARMRDIAETVGVTERAAQRITTDLVEAGYVSRERIGRRNRYRINRKARMRHPAQRERPIGELLGLLSSEEGPDSLERRALSWFRDPAASSSRSSIRT